MIGNGYERIDGGSLIQMLPYFPSGKENKKIKVACTNCGASFKKKKKGDCDGTLVVLECCRGCGKRTLEISK